MQEQSTNAEHVVSKEAAEPSEENMIMLQNPLMPVDMDKQFMHAEYRTHEVGESMSTPILRTEVPDVLTVDCAVVDSDTGTRQDGYEEYEGHAAKEQQPLPDESLVKGANQRLECEPDTSLDECFDRNAKDVAQDGMDEDIQEVQEEAAFSDQVESPREQVGEGTGPRQDEYQEYEGHGAEEQPPLPDESRVKDANQGLECEPDTLLDDCFDRSAKDVAQDEMDFQQVQEEASISDQAESPSEQLGEDTDPRQDEYQKYEEHAAQEQPPLPDESLVKGANQGLECEPDTLLDDCFDRSAKDVAQDDMDEDIQEVLEEAAISYQVESPSEQVGEDPDPRQDEYQEYEGHAALEQPPLPDDSLVKGANQGLECAPDTSLDECFDRSATDVAQDDLDEDTQEVLEEAAISEQVESPREQVGEDPVSDSAKPRSKDEKNARRGSAKPGSIVRDHQVTYELPPENESEFCVFDLVWGKVKSHPWWPGQIFHPSDSSEKAMKYYRKDCYLVAYFGDRSFAWNEASVLKPFRKHFSQEKQSNSESFQNAVNCALAEVSRRMELGLACSCIPEAAYDKIKYQKVENAGIREESSKREGVDRSTGPDIFQSAKLLEYVRTLALSPTSGADRLDLVIAKAQLLAFSRLKGCDALPDFEYYEGLMECDADTSLPGERGILGESEFAESAAGGDSKTKLKGPHKRKHNLKDIVYQRRKEKSLTELMGETMYYLDGEFDSHEEDDIMLSSSPTSGSKRKASGFPTDDYMAQQSTKTISFAKVSHTSSPNPQQSFKVGECIRRVASQLTGSPSIIKGASDESNSKPLGDDVDEVGDHPDDFLTESTMIPQKQSSIEEMLSQLHLTARDPMKGYSFLGDIIRFFSEFRSVAVLTQRQRMRKGSGRKRKPTVPTVGSPETFEFDDRNDSYWTDMVIQNTSEAKPSRRGRKRKDDQSADPGKPRQSTPRKYSRKQYFHGNHEPAAAIPPGDEKKQDQLPTELMLNFNDAGSIPSEVNLNKLFRRFGPLKESETEVDAQSGRARVVYKKRSDAEVAYSSAAMFNIFGSTLVNYQLNYTPSVSFGTLPLALSDTVENKT